MDPLRIGRHEFRSRLLLGTGRYPSPEIMRKCHEAAGTDCVTLAVRRVDLKETGKGSILGHIDSSDDVKALGFTVTALILLAVGLVVGALGSGLTLRRYLKV